MTTTKWITRTAMGVVLVLVAQLIGKQIPPIAVIAGPFSVSQLITGTLVNCVLIVCTAKIGVLSGVTVGVLSAVLATLVGVGPILPVITPVIAVGNAVLCLVYGLLRRLSGHWLGMAAAAAAKCGFLWLAVPLILGFLAAPAQQSAVLTVMFSWPQGVTALCGGILAYPVQRRLK